MTLTAIDVQSFVEQLHVALPSLEKFRELGDRTALRTDSSGTFYRANYERGPLLYALVAHHRPRTVLEFGTGRGYGAICMAWAMEDQGIDGSIYSIDLTPPTAPIRWHIDWLDGRGAHTAYLSRNEVWPKVADPRWLRRIHQLSGFSAQALANYRGPQIDFAFIDGGHDFDPVQHDFYAILPLLSEKFGILFDDYAPKFSEGVQRLINESVLPHFESTLIHTDRRWIDQSLKDQPADYGMLWVDSTTLKAHLSEVYDFQQAKRIVEQYRGKERWKHLRHEVGNVLRRLGLRQ